MITRLIIIAVIIGVPMPDWVLKGLIQKALS